MNIVLEFECEYNAKTMCNNCDFFSINNALLLVLQPLIAFLSALKRIRTQNVMGCF